MKSKNVFFSFLALLFVTVNVKADENVSNEPIYTKDGELIFPENYREWVYLSSGLAMSYSPKVDLSDSPMFDNVFVNIEAYRSFKEKGIWPDKTQLVLEHRKSSSKVSINHHGNFQSGEAIGLEVHVKDASKFKGEWAFFSLSNNGFARKIPETEKCYSCHQKHAAVDTTFVQFYPTLIPFAQKNSTFSRSYLREIQEAEHTKQ